ncbi:MAG: dTDP-4-dehydrorhamnose 3,5-epimerase family protein [Saprospiraceae bacterium]|nr:dTDP-4-dehydrorhamnose 3,5-epimerase family protein [Saprospiraceae bacterium]
MELTRTILEDVKVLKSPGFQDQRGGFFKLFKGLDTHLDHYSIQQINYVQNKQKGILRGLHYQCAEFAESKFFRVLKGRIQLAFIDLRLDSPSYLKSATIILEQADIGVLVPRGFATGYLTLEDETDVLYYSDNIYHPDAEGGIRWNDPIFKIQWLSFNPNLSTKDQGWSDFDLQNS